jgi:hypothetical protein
VVFSSAPTCVAFYFAAGDLKDHPRPPNSGTSFTVVRGKEPMNTLEKATGLVIAGVVTIINKSVFDTDTIWKQYSAFFNVFDLAAVIYICYFSRWGRNYIISISERSKSD